ncbi:ubiquitin carboxyl-terminal hydrolase-domain-containing protein [Lasiosphaeria hispida]|uniref:ubiquitinyl hydrolase 1 n=1 Tax=Lasiosphaeria hispida TaxID=260671 RepID=A0AAJ0HPD7_9PEZI|nr:ubiquitin carboxyl-terminal hydrolase-domain-containing protein [Lasiosphaeria hispida]
MEKLKSSNPLALKKFRSVREKTGSHRRSKSSEPGGKGRGLISLDIVSIFRPESAKQAQREREEEEKEAAKVEDISKRLEELNYNGITEELIRYALHSKFAGGDVEKAVEMVQLQQKAFAGIIQPYNANVQMVGAENRGNVTCYLDALLFAMFAKLSAFECMLKNDSTDEAQRKLGALIRLWVNMLRSGKMIYTDLTQHIQDALAECGWKDAQLLEQQDTSEAFAFITETLQLPLLALQVDLFHHGKGDADDHKVVHERLLNLAVPPDPEGKGLKLEDCLEEYFNNKVDVLRDSFEEKKALENSGSGSKSTIRMVTEEEGQIGELVEGGESEGAPLQRRWTTHEPLAQSPLETPTSSFARNFEPPAHVRHRSTSIIQRIVVNNQPNSTDAENESFLQRAKRTGSTVVKAVTIPAWQFFRLIPWHATSNSEPSTDAEVARHFNQRPVVGICLKRYTMTEHGVPIRQNTMIDIPDSLRLPHFMVVDDVKSDQESSGLSQEYKLELQSVVCHRGDSLHSGHYIAFARVAPKLLTDNRRHDNDPPPDYEEAQWARFDDLAIEDRVTYVDDIKQSLREEMPYLLFYQIVPMVDVSTASTDGSVTEPPSYDELKSIPPANSLSALDAGTDRTDPISRSTSGYFDSTTNLVHNGPSIRFSAEIERPSRHSLDEGLISSHPVIDIDNSRRGSAALSEPAAINPSVTPDAPSPAITPQDETTAGRLSRAAAKFAKTGSKSRPTSQAGEGRISLSISNLGSGLGFRRGGSKEPLNTAAVVGPESLDEQVIVEEDEANAKEKKDEKEHHHYLHHNHTHKKERTKSKSREKEEKKDKGKSKASKDSGVPDRECAVM